MALVAAFQTRWPSPGSSIRTPLELPNLLQLGIRRAVTSAWESGQRGVHRTLESLWRAGAFRLSIGRYFRRNQL